VPSGLLVINAKSLEFIDIKKKKISTPPKKKAFYNFDCISIDLGHFLLCFFNSCDLSNCASISLLLAFPLLSSSFSFLFLFSLSQFHTFPFLLLSNVTHTGDTDFRDEELDKQTNKQKLRVRLIRAFVVE